MDITVHKVVSDGKVEEVIPPLGGPFGGNLVNEEFTKLLIQVLGMKAILSCTFISKHDRF